MVEKESLPTDIDFTDEDVKGAGKRPKLSPGWYRFLTIDERRDLSKESNLMIGLTLAPLEDPEDADSRSNLTIRHFCILPFVNKEVEGHKAPDSVWRCHGVLSAAVPDVVIPTPKKVDGVTVFRGNALEGGRKAYEEAQEECKASTFAACKKWWLNTEEEPFSLLDQAFFAEVFENGEYTNLRKFCAELPPGVELVSPENFKAK